MRRSFRAVLVILVLALLTAGCSAPGQPTPSSQPEPSSVSAPPESSLPEEIPEPPTESSEEPLPPASVPEESGPRKLPTLTLSPDAAELLDGIFAKVNDLREENDLAPLDRIDTVDILAAVRAFEASESWSHTRPDGSSFHSVFAEYGITYAGYGENLLSADYLLTAEQAVQAWFDSPGHRENLLRPEFDGIGIGVAEKDENWYWCQLFVTF